MVLSQHSIDCFKPYDAPLIVVLQCCFITLYRFLASCVVLVCVRVCVCVCVHACVCACVLG